MDALAVARTVSVVLVAGLALLAVVEAPHRALWYAALAATEAGYLLALLALPAFAGGLATRRDLVLAALGALAVLLLLSPLVRAARVARALPARVDAAFRAPVTDRAPLEARRLFAFSSPDVRARTLTYATRAGESLALDLYGDAAPGARRPLVVMIHGGSWSAGDRTQLPAMARRLARAGYAVASIDYRLAPAHPYPAAVDDVRAAVDFLRARADDLGLDPERVVLYGRSAGGHLALLAAYTWRAPFVRGVVALYAPTDLVWSWTHPANPLVLDTPGTLRAFLGGAPDDSAALRARYEDASPLNHVHPGAPPTLLAHGGRDELVKVRQTERLASALERAGVAHLALALPWATHGCEASLAGPSGQLFEYTLGRFLAAVAPVSR